MTALFIASDGHELCLWEGDPADSSPRCVERESDVDPIVWAMVVSSPKVAIPRALRFTCCGTTRVVSSPAAVESARALHECEVAS